MASSASSRCFMRTWAPVLITSAQSFSSSTINAFCATGAHAPSEVGLFGQLVLSVSATTSFIVPYVETVEHLDTKLTSAHVVTCKSVEHLSVASTWTIRILFASWWSADIAAFCCSVCPRAHSASSVPSAALVFYFPGLHVWLLTSSSDVLVSPS